MELLVDTANLAAIKKYNGMYHLTGVTSNPTILAREQADFFPLLEAIRTIIGDKQLHVQVTGETMEQMVREAAAIVGRLGKETYIKVATNEVGIQTMKWLKEHDYRVTATAIYMPQQAMLAASVGADYVAPYFNRMSNLNVDSREAIRQIAQLYKTHHCSTKILAASFKNTQQIMDALSVGAHAVTASVDLFTQMVESPIIDAAIAGFATDWHNVYGHKRIYEL